LDTIPLAKIAEPTKSKTTYEKPTHSKNTIEKTTLPWLIRPGNEVAYSIQAPGPHRHYTAKSTSPFKQAVAQYYYMQTLKVLV